MILLILSVSCILLSNTKKFFLGLTQVHTANIRLYLPVLSSEKSKDTIYGKSQREKYTGLVPVESFWPLEYPSNRSSQILPPVRCSGCPGTPGNFLFVFWLIKQLEDPSFSSYGQTQGEKERKRIHLPCVRNGNNVRISNSTLRCNIRKMAQVLKS